MRKVGKPDAELIQQVAAVVQRNCHIADASHGRDDGMCTYLMKMREYYRWERGLTFDAVLGKDELGDWLCEREALWADLADAEYAQVSVDGVAFDPFDVTAINNELEPHGLVYSAGLIAGGRPHFFLAELELKKGSIDGFQLFVSNRELARGVSAPPAMALAQTIFVRREALRRFVWQNYESWRWNRPNNAFGRALANYPFDSALTEAIERMTNDELDAVMEHEIGEYLAGASLGKPWDDMLMALCGTPAELMARAVRDHIADCTRTLPMLAAQARVSSLHFYMGNLSAMRRQLFPSLLDAYEIWCSSGNADALRRITATGRQHWQSVAGRMLAMHREQVPGTSASIADYVASQRL